MMKTMNPSLNLYKTLNYLKDYIKDKYIHIREHLYDKGSGSKVRYYITLSYYIDKKNTKQIKQFVEDLKNIDITFEYGDKMKDSVADMFGNIRVPSFSTPRTLANRFYYGNEKPPKPEPEPIPAEPEPIPSKYEYMVLIKKPSKRNIDMMDLVGVQPMNGRQARGMGQPDYTINVTPQEETITITGTMATGEPNRNGRIYPPLNEISEETILTHGSTSTTLPLYDTQNGEVTTNTPQRPIGDTYWFPNPAVADATVEHLTDVEITERQRVLINDLQDERTVSERYGSADDRTVRTGYQRVNYRGMTFYIPMDTETSCGVSVRGVGEPNQEIADAMAQTMTDEVNQNILDTLINNVTQGSELTELSGSSGIRRESRRMTTAESEEYVEGLRRRYNYNTDPLLPTTDEETTLTTRDYSP